MITNEKDKKLLTLLKENSRYTVSELARKLNVSRSTVNDRIQRLEKTNIIKGYSLILGDEYSAGLISAHIMMNIDPRMTANVIHNLRQISEVDRCYAVSGIYDLIVIIHAQSPVELDGLLDKIAEIEGVEKTLTSIILSTKMER